MRSGYCKYEKNCKFSHHFKKRHGAHVARGSNNEEDEDEVTGQEPSDESETSTVWESPNATDEDSEGEWVYEETRGDRRDPERDARRQSKESRDHGRDDHGDYSPNRSEGSASRSPSNSEGEYYDEDDEYTVEEWTDYIIENGIDVREFDEYFGHNQN